jgi:hypothetical protein
MDIIAEIECSDGFDRMVKCLAAWRVDLKGITRWVKANPNGVVFVFASSSSEALSGNKLRKLHAIGTRSQIRLLHVSEKPDFALASAMMESATNPSRAEKKPEPITLLDADAKR